MRLAVYTYNAEPFVWYSTPEVSFINLSRREPRPGSKWKVVDPECSEGLVKSPMDVLPGFDAWLWIDPRVRETAINFGEFQFQVETLDPNRIYGIGPSSNGFKTISTGCLAEPNGERNRELLDFAYKTVLPDGRKYSVETPLATFSSLLFLRSPKTENACRDTVDMVGRFPGLNPQVALNWTAWKNVVGIECIEDIAIQPVHHKIWINPFVPSLVQNQSPETSWKGVTVKNNAKQFGAAIKTVDPIMEGIRAGFLGPENMPKQDDPDDQNDEPEQVRRTVSVVKDLPNVSIMMTTWNRTALAVKCLKGLVENIEYPKDKLYWVLADDGSEPGHVEACIDALTQSGVSIDRIFTTRNYRTGEGARFGHPINLNNGMREAFKHSDIVLRTEDDLLPSQKIPVVRFAEILRDNPSVGGIKLAHAADAVRKLPWKNDSENFQSDESYWNVYIFNHLAMICHKRVYNELGMYNEELSGGAVEADMGKRFMNKYRERKPESEYRMNILIPTINPVKTSAGGSISWLYFIHLGKESVSGHRHRDTWNPETVKLNSEKVAETVRTTASMM